METGSYKIRVEKDWSLEDLYIFAKTYEQVYYFVNTIGVNEESEYYEQIQKSYSSFPWQGGYSAVNFYNSLKYLIPKRNRPKVISLRYNSPGWIELALVLGVALNVEQIIKSISNSILLANATYHEVVKGLHERKLLRLKEKQTELNLKRSELRYINENLKTMSRVLGLKNYREMVELTGSPYITLKILLSLYRRVRVLVSYHQNGKIELPKRIRSKSGKTK